jgi:hypothetical protein
MIIELPLNEELAAALHRRVALDGVSIGDVVAHGLEIYLAMRDSMEKEPEIRSEDWTPLYDGPSPTPNALHMLMAQRKKP